MLSETDITARTLWSKNRRTLPKQVHVQQNKLDDEKKKQGPKKY